jgi:kinesin family protein 6/9
MLDKIFLILFGNENQISKYRTVFFYCSSIAYLEIYNDQMCDLLRTLNTQSDYQQQQQQLAIGENSGLVYVKGLSYRIANTEEEALNLLFEGETNRAIGQHVLNKQSSRSHCIFTILIECRSVLSTDEKYTISKLNLVDLAGSERLAKTNVNEFLLFLLLLFLKFSRKV